jgi:hypothetical protein
MATDGNKIKQKLSKIYSCSICDYNTVRKSNFDNHILSAKHKEATDGNTIKQKLSKNINNFECDICKKNYKDRTGLWRHKKKCKNEEFTECESEEDIKNTDEPSDKELIMLLIKENSELKSMMMKVIENGTCNNSNNTTNSHNKSFNLQFFLNETCKDAMNIMDFVDSIKLQLSDLERVGELGYVEGISNIIVKNLKELDITKRPVHCTDKKRETIYIKDENQWEKDDEKKKMHKLVRKVADKNARMIPKYKEVHPDYGKSTSKCSDQYNKIIVESFGNDYEKEEKIIKKVTKEVIVDKES